MGEVDKNESDGAHGPNSRREFLKKAGTAAWVLPTMQVVNMAAARAGAVEGSMVTTMPPTTMPPTTTEGPRCYCEVSVESWQPVEDGYVFQVCVHISDGCTTADNVTLSISDGSEINTGIQDCYFVEVHDNNLGATLSVEIHDDAGTVLTSCQAILQIGDL
ncbi:MAG: hypothetical protein HKN91_13780 [Acidimicrobiia bacterium]|nr:hypothetical protein [Acidimicrobiia bacterium]